MTHHHLHLHSEANNELTETTQASAWAVSEAAESRRESHRERNVKTKYNEKGSWDISVGRLETCCS